MQKRDKLRLTFIRWTQNITLVKMMLLCVRYTVNYTFSAFLFGFLCGPVSVLLSSCQPASFDKDLISEKTQTHPTFSRSLSLIYDTALRYFRQEPEPTFLLMSYLPVFPPDPQFRLQAAHLLVRESFQTFPQRATEHQKALPPLEGSLSQSVPSWEPVV